MDILRCIVCLSLVGFVSSGIKLGNTAKNNAVDLWCSVERLGVRDISWRFTDDFSLTGNVRLTFYVWPPVRRSEIRDVTVNGHVINVGCQR